MHLNQRQTYFLLLGVIPITVGTLTFMGLHWSREDAAIIASFPLFCHFMYGLMYAEGARPD